MGGTLRLAILLAAAAVAAAGPAPAVALGFAESYSGHSYGPVTGSITASKPQSKLWFNRGWWASMLYTATKGHRIFRLDRVTEKWVDTGTALDARAGSRADTLWDAAHGKLYVASHAIDGAGGSDPAKLWRFTYNAARDAYSRDSGFPVTIADGAAEALVIARDSTGTLWATWTRNGQVWVSHTTGGDATWGTPYVLPVAGAAVAPDDLASIVAFGGDRIGVMWSNQLTGQFFFAVHADGAGDGAADWSAAPVPGTPAADDHINLKADGAGRVYAAVKYSTTARSDPFVGLLVRDPASGTWSQHTIGLVHDGQTRPIVLLDEERTLVRVFFTGPEPPSPSGVSGGTIYEKAAPMETLAFPAGPGTPVIRDAGSPALNDVTSTKQSIGAAGGIVLLAGNVATDTYWHADIRLDGSTPPPAPPAPPPPPPAPLTSEFPAVADAQVKLSDPGRNFGALEALRVRTGGDVYRAYLAFSVDDLAGPVVGAKLRLKVANGSTHGGDVFPVTAAWSESTLTWRNAPAPGPSAVGRVGRVAPGVVEVALADGVITGNGDYGFVLAAPADTLTVYSSREGSVAPELVLKTAPPSPAAPPPPAGERAAHAAPGESAQPSAAEPSVAVPPPARAQPALVTAARARQRAAQALRRRWRGASARRLACRRVSRTSFTCRASWRAAGRRLSARVTVTRRGPALTARVLVLRR